MAKPPHNLFSTKAGAAALLLACLLAGLPAGAAPTGPAATADAARGAQRVGTCSHCHGQSGEGLAVSAFPRLAGQSAAYLAKQLHDFAAGSRSHAVMQYFAQSLGERDIADIGAYYARLQAPAARTEAQANAIAAGRQLAESGDAKSGIPACVSCHGLNGRGVPPLLPYLAGQNAEYLTAQLQAWQSGGRRNDAGGQMKAVAARLSAADVAAVAAYFASLPPPE